MAKKKVTTTKKKKTEYSVYILLCADNSLYTGMTNDLARRFSQHQAGIASRYTKAKGVKAVIFTELCGTRSKALIREAAIKKLSLQKKLELISKTTIEDFLNNTKKV